MKGTIRTNIVEAGSRKCEYPKSMRSWSQRITLQQASSWGGDKVKTACREGLLSGVRVRNGVLCGQRKEADTERLGGDWASRRHQSLSLLVPPDAKGVV